MKKMTSLFETVSITSITYYIIMTIALSMMFVGQGDIAMAARISARYRISFAAMGLALAFGIALVILGRSRRWRFIGIVPYLLFLVGIVAVASIEHYSLHVVLVYVGYGVQLILALRNGNHHVT